MITEKSYKSQLLETIAIRASFPMERLQDETKGNYRTDEQGDKEPLQHLYNIVQATDEGKQARFLAQLQVDELQLLQALSLPDSAEQVDGSAWVTLLSHILSQDVSNPLQDPESRDRCFYPESPRPFEDLFLPFINYGRHEFQNLVPDYASLLSTTAQIRLENWLLSQLAFLAGEPLGLEFMYFRALEDDSSILDKEKSRVLYDRFLSEYSGEGLLPFFAEYSLLARMMVLITEQWSEVCAELLKRLKADSDLIAHTFFDNQQLGHVMDIRAGCSDRHNYGHSVFLITFSDNRKLAYKPRDMDIDEAFFKCIAWLNEKGISPDLKCGRVLKRNSYGWMEYIAHTSCKTSEEVHSYYQRCGLLTCLFYALGSTDMHYENLIVHGTYPVPIDLETILSPSLLDLFTGSLAEEQLATCSVRRSGILTTKVKVQGQEIDISVLGEVQAFSSPYTTLTWRNINTDAMTCSYEHVTVNISNDNKVIIDGRIEKTIDFIEDLVTGFRHMYHFLMEHHEEILENGGMLDFFINCPVRFVFRATNLYARHILRLTSCEFLQDGTSHWIVSQIFRKPLLKEQVDDRLWSIIGAELVALERRDVPCFGTRTDSTHLYADGSMAAEDVFVCSALAQVRSCIAELCDEDMEKQIELIYDAYATQEEESNETAFKDGQESVKATSDQM